MKMQHKGITKMYHLIISLEYLRVVSLLWFVEYRVYIYLNFLSRYKWISFVSCLFNMKNEFTPWSCLGWGAISTDDGDDDVEIERLMAFYNDVWL